MLYPLFAQYGHPFNYVRNYFESKDQLLPFTASLVVIFVCHCLIRVSQKCLRIGALSPVKPLRQRALLMERGELCHRVDEVGRRSEFCHDIVR